MKKPSLGCISPLGFVAVLIVIFSVGGIVWARGGVLFNSGPLNAQAGDPLGGVTSHAELDGQCKSCHAAPWETEKMADRCLACHIQISAEIDNPASLHGILKDDYPEMDCRACHTEHIGTDAKLTFLEITEFPHELVGYSLSAHKVYADGKLVRCQDCHTETLTRLDQKVCADCHDSLSPDAMQAHFTLFGLNCLACHDGIDSYGKSFDHTRAEFILMGTHLKTACQDCHPGATTIEMLKSTPQRCIDCHQKDDFHNGNLGEDCAACHLPDDWHNITFDHSITGFALEGKHSDLDCSSCHPGQVYQNTPTECIGCHEKDNPHGALYGTDCSLCHSPVAWNDIHFDHTSLDTTDCQNCHLADKPENHYPGQCSACHTTSAWLPATFDHDTAGATDCQSCHARPEGHYPGQCSACHTTNAWKPAHFDHSVAGATDCQACHFPPGNHYSGQCSSCHSTNSWAFVHSAGTDCQACHTRPAGHYSGQCSACHSISAWRPAYFDHSVAGATDCQVCHAPPGNHYSGQCSSCHSTNNWAFVHSAGTDCQACHQRPTEHAPGQCSQCHNTTSWGDAQGSD